MQTINLSTELHYQYCKGTSTKAGSEVIAGVVGVVGVIVEAVEVVEVVRVVRVVEVVEF